MSNVFKYGFPSLKLATFFLRYTFEGPDLIISNVETGDEGVYTCQIITKLDMAEASSTLTLCGKQLVGLTPSSGQILDTEICQLKCKVMDCVLLSALDRPDPPVLLQLTDAKHRAATLSWTPGDDHNSPILGLVHSPLKQTDITHTACVFFP